MATLAEGRKAVACSRPLDPKSTQSLAGGRKAVACSRPLDPKSTQSLPQLRRLPCVDNSFATCLSISQLLLRPLLYACLKTLRTSRTYSRPLVFPRTSPSLGHLSHLSNPSTLSANNSSENTSTINGPKLDGVWAGLRRQEWNSDPSVSGMRVSPVGL